jgi:hypothetical protein
MRRSYTTDSPLDFAAGTDRYYDVSVAYGKIVVDNHPTTTRNAGHGRVRTRYGAVVRKKPTSNIGMH